MALLLQKYVEKITKTAAIECNRDKFVTGDNRRIERKQRYLPTNFRYFATRFYPACRKNAIKRDFSGGMRVFLSILPGPGFRESHKKPGKSNKLLQNCCNSLAIRLPGFYQGGMRDAGGRPLSRYYLNDAGNLNRRLLNGGEHSKFCQESPGIAP